MTALLGNCDAALRRFWHPVARAEVISADYPQRVMLLGEGYVVWHDRDNDAIVAFLDRCQYETVLLAPPEFLSLGGPDDL